MTFAAADPGFEGRVRKSFSRLALMRTIGARLVKVAPGEVDVDMPFRDDLTQQHGFVAAGIVTAIVDTACGYAAMSLMPAGATVLTVEYKVNFISSARGDRLIARGRVVKPGRALTICAGEVYSQSNVAQKAVATMLGTMMAVQDRPEVPSTGCVTATQTWDPERYARNARYVTDLAMPVVELLAPRAGERILDLGWRRSADGEAGCLRLSGRRGRHQRRAGCRGPQPRARRARDGRRAARLRRSVRRRLQQLGAPLDDAG